MDVHLDGERTGEAPAGQNQLPNRRNGRSQKTVTTDSGKVVPDIPRDRNGTVDPLLIAKYQRRFPEFDRSEADQETAWGAVSPPNRQHVCARHDDPRE
jgi:putative transposase